MFVLYAADIIRPSKEKRGIEHFAHERRTVMSKNLFTPIRIGSVTIKNRLVVPAMGTNLAKHNGEASPELIKYYTERAKGGFGLIIQECSAIARNGKSLLNECAMWDDYVIPSYRELTDSVHEAGGKIFCQLRHTGRETNKGYTEGLEVVAPSQVPCPACQEMPHALTTEEVYSVIEEYAAAAKRVKDAGYDGLEIHASHGYLPAQFLSPHANKRTDEFGGSLHNRMRFLRLVIRYVREVVGEGYPIVIRISGTEMIAGGRELQETKAVCQMLEEEGVDAINVSISTYGSLQYCVGASYLAPGYQVEAAAAIKKLVDVPVMTVGRITDGEIAEAIVSDGSADMVCIGRASVADPHFAEKIEKGNYEDIIPCISCGQGCIMHCFTDEPMRCVVNTNNGTEEEFLEKKVTEPKKIMVIGGGPGGMQAAWILAGRGHNVSLYEKDDHLGGEFLAASYPPGKGTIGRGIGFWIKQCNKYGVDVHLNTEVTFDMIKAEAPDTVILATGSKNLVPRIPGLDPANILEPTEVLLGKKVTGQKVLVCGGGLIGAETANFLAEQKRDVTIVEMKDGFVMDLDPYAKPMLLREMQESGIKMMASTAIQSFLPDGITYKNLLKKEPEVETLDGFDSIVLALGHKAYNPLEEAVKEICNEVYVIGDAKKAGFVWGATYEAADIAMNI